MTVIPAPFTGTQLVKGNWNSQECKNDTISYVSGTSQYNMVIREGSVENEILIDNLGNLGVNDVRCKVGPVMSFVGKDVFEFEIISGQTLIDKNGDTWNYLTSGVRGEYNGSNACRWFKISLRRNIVCGGSNAEAFFIEHLTSCD